MPMARQSRPPRGWKKRAANAMKITELMTTRTQRPPPKSSAPIAAHPLAPRLGLAAVVVPGAAVHTPHHQRAEQQEPDKQQRPQRAADASGSREDDQEQAGSDHQG